MKHFIEVSDFSKEELISLIEVGQDIMQNPAKYGDAMKGRLLATLFYEPSTRTRFSFEAAMLRLGGQVIGFSEAQNSSVAKGESVKDTIRTVACYADIAVMRHYLEGAPKLASVYSDIPVVNAGDGGHQHPTQTITDLLTIQMEKGRLTNLNVVLCGDLKNGRTVHSLVKALSKFENNTFYFVSPKELKIPDYIKNHIKDSLFFEMETLEEGLPMADVLYMTRIQRERFADPEQYEKLKDSCVLTKHKMVLAKSDMIVMHPLPRVNEISEDVDSDPRAVYFPQAKYGMFVRMALILKLVSEKENSAENHEEHRHELYSSCSNPKCVSNHEKLEKVGFGLLDKENHIYACEYCDTYYAV
ncbi:aspartate carbamoyltransferase [Acetoanaerobium noterae]|uniref:aspartate carbamoyltransferase n=1 Tax=Acetoanaerobium noterae TaxID=745369 RepID=UPI003342845E